jgi:subfamily B ATP-binding cassette protein MsbA
MSKLSRLLSYLKPYRGRVALAVLLSFGAAALTSLSLSTLIPILRTLFSEGGLASVQDGARDIIGFVSADLADGIVSTFLHSPLAALASMLGAVLVMTVLKGVLRFGNGYLVGTVAVAAGRDITNGLYAHLIRQPVLFFEREGVGTVASRFTADADEVVRGLKTLTGTLFREPLQFLCLLVVAIWISPLLTLASLLIFPIIGLLIRQGGRVAKRNARQVLAHRSRLLGILQESFFGIRVVQAFRAEARERERFVSENRQLFERNRRLVRVEAAISPAMELLVVLGVGGALLLGGAMAIRGDLDVALLVTFYGAVGALYEPVRKLGSAVPRLQAGLAGSARIFAYLDREPEVREAPDAAPLPELTRSIRFEGVTVTYGGAAKALRGVDLEIRAGEQIAFVGPSGAGKSSLVALLPRFFDPEEGAVLFDGTDVRTATLASLRSQIALVPQETVLLNDSLRANIAFSRPLATDEDYDTTVAERGASLSGGQRQRIAIARALLARPRVLILDEATSNVDEESARLIREALARTREGRTTIVISHRLETLAASDRIAVLDEGRLQAVGSHEELLEKSTAYRDLAEAAAANRAGLA